MEYRLYVFLINYKYLQDIYKKDLDIQFENIKDFLVYELKKFNYELEESDNRSLVFKTKAENDFKSIFQLAKNAESAIKRLKSLLKDFEGELFIKLGIITLEEKDKKHAFKWNFSFEEIKTLPNILLTDKSSFSIIENYDVKSTDLKNIWITNGIEISRSQRIRKIYFNRDEENQIEDFIIKPSDEQVLFVYGDIGSGKSGIINEVVKRVEDQSIIHLRERKHSTKEFRIVHDLMFNLMFVSKNREISPVEDVLGRIENSNLPSVNKKNLIYFINNLYGERPEENKIIFEYGIYKNNLKTALNDCMKLYLTKSIVVIDDHQWMSRNCEEMILGLLDNHEGKIKLILVSDDKNNSNNIKHQIKFLRISEINKVQISKLLQLTFPRTKIIGKTADFVHKATGGNLYTVLSYIQYLIDKNSIIISDGKVELKIDENNTIPDNLSDIFSDKIASLSENGLTLLKILSTIGEQFFYSDLDWLLHVMNYPFDDTMALKELEDKGIIENIGDYFIISEPSIMNDVYKTVKDSNRKLIHKLLAELFETKGYDDFGFKVFFHYYRAENFEKLFSILPELIRSSHFNMHFNAMRNMLEISDKTLFKMCLKETAFPIELWLNNLIYSKWLFDKDDPVEHIKRFEKAIDYLIKIEKKELSLDLFDILLNFYIESDKLKKFENYITTGMEVALQCNSVAHRYRMQILKSIMSIRLGRTKEAVLEFEQAEELRKSIPETADDEKYIYLKAMIFNIKNETRFSLDLLNGLLNKYSDELNFYKINSILKLLIELSLKTRNYKYAEEYCKILLNSKRDEKDDATSLTGNLLLAKLYSYQNKFLQSISLLESVIDGIKDENLYFSSVYTLGSIYQFYNEKEMALKTFIKACDKIKDPKSHNFYMIRMKLALISAFSDETDKAVLYLDEVKDEKDSLSIILKSILEFSRKKHGDSSGDEIFSILSTLAPEQDYDLAFETKLLFLKLLYAKRKFIKCRELSEIMSAQVNFVDDYNLALEFNKLSKNLIKNAYKAKKSINEIRKVSPSVKKRVRNRRSN